MKADAKEYLLCVSMYMTVGCGIDNRRIERNFSDSGNVVASDCDGSFMTLYSCQNILKIGDFIVSAFQS